MKRPCIVLILLLLALFRASAEEDNSGQLIVATEHYPPYEMENPIQGLQGFDYEVLMLIAKMLDLDISIRFYPWKRAMSYTKTGKVLGILTCAYQKERAEFILYSDPISDYDDGYYYRKDFATKNIHSLSDFIGTRVASVDGYESFQELEKVGANPIAAPTTELAVHMLKGGRFDYLHLGREPTDFVIKSLGLENYFNFEILEKQNFYFCFSKLHSRSATLIKPFNNALDTLIKSGKYKAIHDKYR